MRVGERVCTVTTDGNLGVLRLTQVPSKVLPRLDFDHTTGQGRQTPAVSTAAAVDDALPPNSRTAL
ncbi:hypothetical protein [Lentzea aerocolonigenes]|nr:hypothetical protein [Lentzea aerocolonigenes]